MAYRKGRRGRGRRSGGGRMMSVPRGGIRL